VTENTTLICKQRQLWYDFGQLYFLDIHITVKQ